MRIWYLTNEKLTFRSSILYRVAMFAHNAIIQLNVLRFGNAKPFFTSVGIRGRSILYIN